MNTYIRRKKDKYPDREVNKIPIKAKFPQRTEFTITARTSTFEQNGKYCLYVHEIMNDDSPIGFSKFTTFFQGKNIVTESDDIGKLPTVPVKNPSETSERLKPEHASRRYKQNVITVKRKEKCNSLAGIEISTDKITDEDILVKLKIMEETLSDENVDQSLTDSSRSSEKKTRKTRVSAKGKEFVDRPPTELTHNFDEFKQYTDYMDTQKKIEGLKIQAPQKMETINNGENENPNPKCMMQGRERQYITATFKYKDKFVGLLELENSASTSTWVISSKNAFGNEMFEKFLKLYVKDDLAINTIKNMHNGSSHVKFKTKNHERSTSLTDADKTKWVVGVLGKT